MVPFTPVAILKKGGIGSTLGSLFGKESSGGTLKEENFKEYATQLYQRVDSVRQGLTRTGVRMAPLNTEELIELLYGLYNPGELEKGRIREVQR